MDILEVIRNILQESEDLVTQVKPDEVKPEHEYRNDLGLDSLGLMTLAFELQEKYPELDETVIAEWKTVGDSIETIKKLG
ncbi:MAG: hypothetical protein KC493_04980 [Bacteriovoracaceae bacterium]|nr:hypothetical protein [Bacteriovoracaceae bacterium]